MAVFTSSQEELNGADIQRKSAKFTCRFSAQLDSKGRITIPARIRKRLNLQKGDQVPLALNGNRVVRKEFSDKEEVLEFISKLREVESFNFDGEVLEVVLSE